MITIQQAYHQLRAKLQSSYEQREAAAIAVAVIEHVTGFNNSARLIYKNKELTQEQAQQYHTMMNELLQQKPLQYVLHEAPFYGMNLYVDESVLIPRPETEELVDWIIEVVNGRRSTVNGRRSTVDGQQPTTSNILDIGTGSGCIPIALKKHLPEAVIHAIDISEKAVAVAKKNAEAQGTSIHFYLMNILDKSIWQQLGKFDIIVSNPPYITQKEAALMHNNILLHEPHEALFVPDEQPLLFYEAIAQFGLQYLNSNGLLFFEINEVYGKEIVEMLAAKGFQSIELKKDMQGKDRMIKAALLR